MTDFKYQFFTLLFFILTAKASVLTANPYTIEWSIQPSSSVTYTVTRNKDFEGGSFLEKDVLDLWFTFNTDGTTTVVYSGDSSAPLNVTPDGRFTPKNSQVHWLARFLLLIPPAAGTQAVLGDEWLLKAPEDADLTDDHLEVQMEHKVKFVNVSSGANGTLLHLEVEGKRRFIDNTHIRSILGQPQPGSELETALLNLSSWQPYLIGSLVWNLQKGRPEQADFTLVPPPHVLQDFNAVLNSEVKQHVSYRLSR